MIRAGIIYIYLIQSIMFLICRYLMSVAVLDLRHMLQADILKSLDRLS
jgi:hypothetical protein